MTRNISIQSALVAIGSLAVLASMLLPNMADAHSRMLTPAARWGGFCTAKDGCPSCGYTNASAANPSLYTYKRGQSLNVTWARNNHPGGFVQISIVEFTRAGRLETVETLSENIVHYACAESNCWSHTSDPLGIDGDGYGEDQNICYTDFKVPANLRDGQYTMSWSWQNTRGYYGDVTKGLAPFYGCHDFTVSGGASLARGNRCPSMKLGDPHSKNTKQCGYFGPATGNPSDALWCPKDNCTGTWRLGAPGGYATCV